MAALLIIVFSPTSTPLQNRAGDEAKRSSVELRSLVDGFGCFVFVGRATGPHPIFLDFGIAVHKNIKLIRVSQAFPEKPAGATHICPASIRTLNGPLLGLGACWGSI